MTHAIAFPTSARRHLGWVGVAALVLIYAGLFAANYWLPLGHLNLTSRIWNWSQTALTAGACLVVIVQRTLPPAGVVLLGLALAALSAAAHALHDPGLSWSLQEGFGVWICFVAGDLLFRPQAGRAVAAFQPPPANVARSVLLGSLVAIPLAIVNNLYFYLNAGGVQFQGLFRSAFAALSPAIHEEIIFRYFVLAVVLRLLGSGAPRRLALAVALVLAIVPHSLNHLPELFLANPVMGLAMLAATSLLFGLPMAFLQVRRSLEAAIAFHWFIDFARFLFGY
jgi:hypothetical protein